MEYNTNFCRCGRIHAIKYDDSWDFMKEDYRNRKVAHVCSHCGSSFLMFLTEYEDGYSMNSMGLQDTVIDEVSKLIVDSGIILFTESGHVVDQYVNGYFVNEAEWAKHQYDHTSLDEAYRAGEKWCRVDAAQLIKDVYSHYKAEADAILKSISGYAVKIDWSGTKYDHDLR